MLKPFFLKKLVIGPITVPANQAIIFVIKFEEPNLSSIILSVLLWDSFLSVCAVSFINIRPMLQAIIKIPKIRKVICQ